MCCSVFQYVRLARVYCDLLQTHQYDTLQQPATHTATNTSARGSTIQKAMRLRANSRYVCSTLQHTLQHKVPHTLQHTATHCNTRTLGVPALKAAQCGELCVCAQIAATYATHCIALQHTLQHTLQNTLQHTHLRRASTGGSTMRRAMRLRANSCFFRSYG